MLTQWDKGKQLILKKNPHYYAADKVNIPEVHYYIVQKNSLALAMYEIHRLKSGLSMKGLLIEGV